MKIQRQYDLDWIKIMATYAVFLFHCSMFFNPFPWHVKNSEINSSYILTFSLIVGTWLMPIFFALSGISSYYSLQKRSGKGYVKERVKRLGIPLLFGIFVLSPPQVYIERITHLQFSGSLLTFLPKYFDGLYLEIGGEGNFAFVGLHLWYLLVLLLFSILTLPILNKTRTTIRVFSFKHYFLLLGILILANQFLNLVNLGGWGLPYYLTVYLFGYYFFSNSFFKTFLHRQRYLITVLSILMSIVYTAWFMNGIPYNNLALVILFNTVKVLSSLNCMLLIFYLSDRYLKKPTAFFKYNSSMSMPFYVLHQPVIVGVGFMIFQYDWPILLKLVFLICLSFMIILGSYEYLIKRVNFLRILFGMKGQKSSVIRTNHTLKG